ncbi:MULTISPECIES: hypothetical protein [Isoptericola]|uniref:hypothetical protein n=2 Tax=Promicromonosporaceae TaxID=85017 RepID=UPI000D077A92|nr:MULTISPECIES: hypothetical protein [Isoptericola]
MSSGRDAVRRAWAEFVGPEATPVNHALTALTTAVGAVVAPVVARRRGAARAGTVAACLLAVDLSGGAYVNNTRACARWYERPGQGDAQHLTFAALHVHPAAVAWLDRGAARRVPGAVWAAAHYVFLLESTAAIRRYPDRRRPLGVALTVGGLLLDGALGPSVRAPWFAWAYYPKLLLGHAAASWWSDEDLRAARQQ